MLSPLTNENSLCSRQKLYKLNVIFNYNNFTYFEDNK